MQTNKQRMSSKAITKRLVELSMLAYYTDYGRRNSGSVAQQKENREKLERDRQMVLDLFPEGSLERKRLLYALSETQKYYDDPSRMMYMPC